MQPMEPLGAIGEIGGGGDEGLDFNGAGCNGLDGIVVFSGGGAASVNTEFAGDDCLERKGDFGFQIADASDAAAFADGVDRDLDGGAETDDFHGDVGAVGVTDEFTDFSGDIVSGDEGVVGSELERHGESLLVDIDGDDGTGSFSLQCLDDEQPDQSRADDDSGVSLFQRDAVDAVQGDGDGLGEGCLFVGDGVGDGTEDVLRDFDELGKGAVAAVIGAGDAQDVAVGTEIDLAAEAGLAFSAIDGGVEGDAVADFPSGHAVAYVDDLAGGFVSHNDGGNASTGAAVHAVDVRATDAARFDGDEHLFGGYFRIRGVAEFEFVVSCEGECFHR